METKETPASLGERLDQSFAYCIRMVGEVIDIAAYWGTKAFWWYVGILLIVVAIAFVQKTRDLAFEKRAQHDERGKDSCSHRE